MRSNRLSVISLKFNKQYIKWKPALRQVLQYLFHCYIGCGSKLMTKKVILLYWAINLELCVDPRIKVKTFVIETKECFIDRKFVHPRAKSPGVKWMFAVFKDPLSINNLHSRFSTLLLRSYVFFYLRKYKLRSYIDSCNGTTRVQHINSTKKWSVSWFTKPVEQSGLIIALS